MSRDAASPSGLGWTARWVSGEAGGSTRLLHSRRLFAGLTAISCVVFFGAAALFTALGAFAMGGLMAAGGLAAAGGLVGTSRGVSLVWLVHPYVFACSAVCWVAVGAQGGATASGSMAVWAMLQPFIALLLLGRRHAAVWLALEISALVVLSVWAPTPLLPTPQVPATVWNVSTFGLVSLALLSWFTEQREIAEAEVERERERADRLLVDILPASIAERLKRGERVVHGRTASILFADLVGFTTLSASLTPRELLEVLEGLFEEIDALIARHGMEKIKTIGDCVMVASGLPSERADHAASLAAFAMDLATLVEGRSFSGHHLSLRIGMHCGPVVAGVIGRSRFLYDVWGDTVNTASRMESSGVPGRVQVSAAMAEALQGGFLLTSRGVHEVKGLGAVETFLIDPPTTSLSE